MTGTVRLVVSRALTAAVVASLLVLPFAQLAQAAVDAPSAQGAVEAIDTTSAAPTALSIPTVTLDTAFTPLPRGSASPWDGEVVLDGIDGLTYNSPGTEVKVRAMSSNAAFVDEVWLVYPTVKYLFTNKDIVDHGGGFQEISFSDWVTVGKFPPGTELIFGVKTGVGIFLSELGSAGNTVADQCGRPGNHCYRTTQDPSYVPLAPDPKRVCALTDEVCRNKAWPSQTPDGRSIFYTGPGVRNVKDNSPHGRFQYLTNTKRDGTGTALTNTALFGLEDVGAPLQRDGSPCPGAVELASLKTTTEVVNKRADWDGDGDQDDADKAGRLQPGQITEEQVVGLSSVSGLAVGKSIKIFQPFQSEVVTITAIVGNTIRALFLNPDNKPYPAGTSWAPDGCDWHPDFQDAGLVVWPALAATCQSTATQDKVVIVGQEGYGSVTIRDTTKTSPFTQTFAPGDQITFSVAPSGAGSGVSGASPNWSIQLGRDTLGNAGQALMSITDPTKSLTDPNRTLDAGLCYDPGNPPLPLINAIVGTSTCDAGWDFTISNVTTATAPPSIRVTWTNDQTPPADEAATIPLSSLGADGVAHYRSDLHTSLRVVGATTTAPSLAWVGSTGSFKMETGPCPVNKVADVTAACPVPGATAWDITISGTTQHQAPSKVKVTWEGGAQADVALSGPVGIDGIARYTTSLNLDKPITEATAFIQGTWAGAFKVNGATCPGKKQLTLAAVPACTAGVAKWDFAISNMTATLAPASVSALWTGQSAPEAVALTGTVGTDGIAHYTTAAHTGTSYAALVSVTAQITFPSDADAAGFTGTLTAPGIPCAPPPDPSPSPSTTPGLGRCEPIYNPSGKNIPTAGQNPKSGQNPDGFYRLAGPAGWTVRIKDTQSAYITPPFATGTTIKLTEANGKTPTFAPGAGAINYHVWLRGDAELQFFDANGVLVNKATCHVPTHPKGDPEPCVTASPSPRPTPTRTPNPSPKPGSGTGTGGSKAGTRGASSAGSSAGTNSKTNSGTASKSAGGTNTGTNGASNSGSNSGTKDGGSRAGTASRTNNGSGSRTNDGSGSRTVGQSGSKTNDDSGTGTRMNDGSGSRTRDTGGTSAGTNAGTKSGSCSEDGDDPKPSATPKPSHTPKPSQTPKPSETPRPSQTPKPSASPTTPPPSASPTTGIIQVKTSTLLQHECNSSEWHFVITSVNLLTAPLTISVTWSNGQSAVVPLEKVSGGTAHYRTKLNLNSQVTGATAAMNGSYGQFNVSHGPCKVLLGNTTEESGKSPKPSETPKPSATPSPSPTTSSSGSSGGTRTITLKVKAPGGGYQYVTVTVPR